MISTDMRFYNYYTLGSIDAYGQPAASKEPVGQIKMAINISSQSTQDNVLYKNCSYVGLTQNPVNDTYIIDYNGERLKVLYVNTKGRYTQVFMQGMN